MLCQRFNKSRRNRICNTTDIWVEAVDVSEMLTVSVMEM